MTKSTRAKREKQKDFVKKKIKVGKTLKKPQNETITTFKTRAIQINKQLQEKESGEEYTSKRYSLEELMMKLDHPSMNRKLDACNGMKEIMMKLPMDKLEMKLSTLMVGVSRCLLSDDSKLRSSAIRLIDALLEKVGAQRLSYHFKILGVHISCCLVSLHSDIKADCIKLLHILLSKGPSLLRIEAVTLVPNLLRILGAKARFGIDLHKEFNKTSTASDKKNNGGNGNTAKAKATSGMVMRVQEASILTQLDVCVLLAGILKHVVEAERVTKALPLTPFKLLQNLTTPTVESTERFILLSDETKLEGFCSALLPAAHSIYRNLLPEMEEMDRGLACSSQSAYGLQCLLQLLDVTEQMVEQCVTLPTQCKWYTKLVRPILEHLMGGCFPFILEETDISSQKLKNSMAKKSHLFRYAIKPTFSIDDLNVRTSTLAAKYRVCKGQCPEICSYLEELLSAEDKVGLYDMEGACDLVISLVDYTSTDTRKRKKDHRKENSASNIYGLIGSAFKCYKSLHPLKKQRQGLLRLLLCLTDADHRALAKNADVVEWCQYLLQEVTEDSSDELKESLSQLCLRGHYIGTNIPSCVKCPLRFQQNSSKSAVK